MLSPRLMKLVADLSVERGRVMLMSLAVSVSLIAVGTVLGAYAVLTREIQVNYMGTHPASATLEIPAGVEPATVAAARQQPGIADAEARDVLFARVRVGEDWHPLLLFVIDDFRSLRLNVFRPESGAWPPRDGEVLLERAAVSVIGVGSGGEIDLRTPGGAARRVRVAGLVHDPGLAPAWQERAGYAYVTRATLPLWGEPDKLNELRIAARDPLIDAAGTESLAKATASNLAAAGIMTREIQVPPPREHPHGRQMTTVILLLLSFSIMALVLSAIMVSTSLAAILARQVREVGVMKTIGARTGQIVGLYAAWVVAMSLAAVVVAVPLGILASRLMAGVIATMLNFTLTSSSVPWWVLAIQAGAGILVPLLAAAVPIVRASRVSVSQALNQFGGAGDTLRRWFSPLPVALRNALRRPARLALTVGLLAAGGAMFMTALNVLASWEGNLDKIVSSRHYDVEVRFRAPEGARIAELLRRVPDVELVESWGFTSTAFAKPGEIDVVHTYPDRGHGSLSLLAPPAGTRLVAFPLLAGRWLTPTGDDEIVLNHGALAQAPGTQVGDTIWLSLDGRPTAWRLVGVVEEIGSPGAAYVNDHALARIAGTGDAARTLRVATTVGSSAARAEVIRAIEAELTRAGVTVQMAISLAELRSAVGEHIVIFIRLLIAMAMIMAIVGVLGLMSSMSTSVIERTREIGVMKTLGAPQRRIMRLFIEEALTLGMASWVAALALALPLTATIDRMLGMLGFLAPLPFVFAYGPALLWLAIVLALSGLATWLPARRASTQSISEALAHV